MAAKAAPTKQLEAHEKTLADVFCDKYQFTIPDYQRPYSWGREQTAELLDDVTATLEAGGEDPYFLGSIVLVKQANDPAADVIDGQQRLTTLTILLAVIRDLISDEGLRGELEKYLVNPGSEIEELPSSPRLALRGRDNDFFASHVQSRGGITGLVESTVVPKNDAQRALVANALLLHERLKDKDKAGLVRLAQFLMRGTYLVVVSTPDLEAAHRIFSVMNSRGMDLSPADIFKARAIGAIDEDSRAAYATRWEDAEEGLGRADFADLFLHIRMMRAMTRAKKDLLREFQEQVLDAYLNQPGGAEEFIDEVVVTGAGAYTVIANESYSAARGADAVNAWLRRLNRLDNNDWKPVALWALVNHRDDPDTLAGLLQRLERVAASMLIRRTYATPRATRYAELLTQLDRGDGPAAAAFDLTPAERRATLDALDADIYNTAPVRKYVLLRLDEQLSAASGVTYDHRVISVEHVLPQSPMPDSVWNANFTDDEHDRWLHRLSNLVLLSRAKNSQAGRYDFDEKKTKYFTTSSGTSNFALTTQIIAASEWTPATLAARQAQLLDTLTDVWGLENSPGEVASPSTPPSRAARPSTTELLQAGVLRAGEQLRATHKNKHIYATLTSSGDVAWGGQVFGSLSGAGQVITGWQSCNGWTFWSVCRDGIWVSLDDLAEYNSNTRPGTD